jgi:hypothetical protein
MKLTRLVPPVAAALALLAAPAAASANASAAGPAATGSVGSANAFVKFQPVKIAPLAPCATGGSGSGTTSGAAVNNVVTYGPGQSTCALDATTGFASAKVTGGKFMLTSLVPYGGPTLKVSSFTLTCTTTENGSQSSLQVTGLTGITVPNPIPANYTATIPSSTPGAKPVAKVIVNEVITPDPADGSLTINLLHIHLSPEGGYEDSGEIVLGTVSCSPNLDAS